MRFTAGESKQPRQGMELQEKWEEKDVKHTGKLFRWISVKLIPIEKTLHWIYFYEEPRVQKKQKVKDQSVFLVYLTYPSSGWEHKPKLDSSIPCKDVWLIYRDKEQLQEKETS